MSRLSDHFAYKVLKLQVCSCPKRQKDKGEHRSSTLNNGFDKKVTHDIKIKIVTQAQMFQSCLQNCSFFHSIPWFPSSKSRDKNKLQFPSHQRFHSMSQNQPQEYTEVHHTHLLPPPCQFSNQRLYFPQFSRDKAQRYRHILSLNPVPALFVYTFNNPR